MISNSCRHNPLTPNADKYSIVLGAFIDGCMVDSIAFDGEEKIPAMKALLLGTYGPKATVYRKVKK